MAARADLRLRSRYTLLVVLPLLLVLLVVLEAVAAVPDAAMERQRLALCVVSALCNVFVLFYHSTTPPHPKFLMLGKRRLVIRLHVAAGVVELVAGIVALLSSAPMVPAIVMALAGLAVHIPTAAYQASIVFGARAVMAPGYMFVIAMHAWSAVHLLLEPGSRWWLVNTFLALNVYVWCRVFIGVFKRLGLFPDSRYTVSIMFAGLLLVPAVIGVAGNLLLFCFIVAHMLLFMAMMRPSADQLEAHVSERRRESLINGRVRETWAMLLHDNDTDGDAGMQARILFDGLDTDGDNALSVTELTEAMHRWRVSPEFTEAFMRHHAPDGIVDFDTFHRRVFQLHQRTHPLANAQMPDKPTEEQRARTVFDLLDLDGSGVINVFELRLLLLDWGLPEEEVDRYLHAYDDGDRQLTFAEFFAHMRPIWQFGFHQARIIRHSAA